MSGAAACCLWRCPTISDRIVLTTGNKSRDCVVGYCNALTATWRRFSRFNQRILKTRVYAPRASANTPLAVIPERILSDASPAPELLPYAYDPDSLKPPYETLDAIQFQSVLEGGLGLASRITERPASSRPTCASWSAIPRPRVQRPPARRDPDPPRASAPGRLTRSPPLPGPGV